MDLSAPRRVGDKGARHTLIDWFKASIVSFSFSTVPRIRVITTASQTSLRGQRRLARSEINIGREGGAPCCCSSYGLSIPLVKTLYTDATIQ